MKRTILLSLFYLLITLSSAQPLLVGHRGSQWGVENTAEALINGALKGYHYLECDIKVAADGTIVLSHDDNTSRLGGSLTISKSTLAQLQSETYTQTRGGVTYTGTINHTEDHLVDKAREVQEYYNNGGDVYDIARIAATEAHRDANAAAYDAAKAAGAKRKTWHCMMLPTSRDEHIWLDGVSAPIDGYFYSSIGERTQYPGQWGVPEQDINCLCWLTYE